MAITLKPALAQRDAEQCRTWSYDEGSLSSDLKAMRAADVGEWGRACYQFACSAIGAVHFDGQPYEVEVNAGGWAFLRDKNHKVRRILITDTQRSGFLATCNCCE
jgi:hypothetical protein